MNDLLKRVRELNNPADESLVQQFIEKNDAAAQAGDKYYSIATLAAVLGHYEDERKSILKKDLLEWMNENDQVTFETEDMKVSIKTYVSAKVLDPELAFKWLEDRQYGSLIKDTVNFDKGEFDKKLEEFLNAEGYSYTQKQAIHPQSLLKIFRDRLNDGEDLPESADPDNDDPGDGFKVGYHDECVVKEK